MIYTPDSSITKDALMSEALAGIKASYEEGMPDYYSISYHYTNHIDCVINEIKTLEEAIDELIHCLTNHGEIEEWDEGYQIDGYYEENEVLEALHYEEIQEIPEGLYY